jgi:hypothetical protein
LALIATTKTDQNQAILDPWSIVHLAAGLAAGLIEVPAAPALLGAIVYELAERSMEQTAAGQAIFKTSGPERGLNAVADVALFALGQRMGRAWNRTT